MKTTLIFIFYLIISTAAFSQYGSDKYFDPNIVTTSLVELKIKKPIPDIDGYDRIEKYKKGFYWVYKNDKQGLINEAGEEVIEAVYDNIEPYQKRYAWIYKGDKQGLISLFDGKIIFEPVWDNIEGFVDGKAKALKDGKEYLISIEGKILSQ